MLALKQYKKESIYLRFLHVECFPFIIVIIIKLWLLVLINLATLIIKSLLHSRALQLTMVDEL